MDLVLERMYMAIAVSRLANYGSIKEAKPNMKAKYTRLTPSTQAKIEHGSRRRVHPKYGGEGGIRTLEPLRVTGTPDPRARPLRDLSKNLRVRHYTRFGAVKFSLVGKI